MKRTPLEITILIHYFTCADDYKNLDAPAVKDAIEYFVSIGLLSKESGLDDVRYSANYEALKPYIEALSAIPLPKQKWVIEK